MRLTNRGRLDPPVAASVYYVYADHLNTPRVITDGTNKIVWRWHSDPFGADAANEDPDGDGVKFRYNLRFPGQYFDKETSNGVRSCKTTFPCPV